jgi:hypothetical protein
LLQRARPDTIVTTKLHMDGVDDQFAVGSFPAMLLYGSLWPCLRDYRSRRYLPFTRPGLAERLLFNHLFACGLNLSTARRTSFAVERRRLPWPGFFAAAMTDLAGLPVDAMAGLRGAIEALARAEITRAQALDPRHGAEVAHGLAQLGICTW